MRKIVLTFGLISGAILSVMMLATMPFHDQIGFDHSLIIGYTTMVVASLLIYFGVRSYRDNVAGGSVSFFRALGVGVLIAMVASVCYVVTWEFLYHTVAGDYGTKYSAYVLDKARAEGASQADLAKKKAELDRMWELYKNPAFNVAITFLEPLPVTLVFALVSAGLVSRRRKDGAGKTIAGVPA